MQDLLQKIKDSKPRCLTYDEAKTRQVIILPILQKLGWDIFDGEEVFPEYGLSGKRVDFSLRTNNKNDYFIEVKKCSVDLNIHQEQLLNYAFREGVSLACLTNGIIWQFFLPLTEGDWKNRLFHTINIEEQEVEEISLIFHKILNKGVVISKEAVQNAKDLQYDKLKTIILKKSIPEVWENLLLNPSDILIDLISEKVENHSGYRPSSEDICLFLSEYRKTKQDAIINLPKYKVKNSYTLQTSEDKNILRDRSYVIIKGEKIYSEPVPGKSKEYILDVLPKLLIILPQSEIDNLQNVAYCNSKGLSGNQYPIISKRKDEMYGNDERFRAYPEQISGFWVTAQWSAYFPAWEKYLQYLAQALT